MTIMGWIHVPSSTQGGGGCQPLEIFSCHPKTKKESNLSFFTLNTIIEIYFVWLLLLLFRFRVEDNLCWFSRKRRLRSDVRLGACRACISGHTHVCVSGKIKVLGRIWRFGSVSKDLCTGCKLGCVKHRQHGWLAKPLGKIEDEEYDVNYRPNEQRKI